MTAKKDGDDFSRQEAMRSYYDESDYFTRENVIREIHNPQTPFQRYRLEKILQIYRPGREERVLDLGSGWGTIEKALYREVREITGLDYSQKSVDICNEAFKGLDAPNVRFIRADASATGLPAQAYDTIICADLVEHLYPEVFSKTMAECGRLLKPGGRLVIWTDCAESVFTVLRERNIILKKDLGHVDYKSMQTLKDELSGLGFVVEKAYYAESHVPVISFLEKLLMPFLPAARRRIAVLARKPETA